MFRTIPHAAPIKSSNRTNNTKRLNLSDADWINDFYTKHVFIISLMPSPNAAITDFVREQNLAKCCKVFLINSLGYSAKKN